MLFLKEGKKYALLMCSLPVPDPGFPTGGGLVLIGGGCVLLMRLCFENLVCQNKRIWTLGSEACTRHSPHTSANDYTVCVHQCVYS